MMRVLRMVLFMGLMGPAGAHTIEQVFLRLALEEAGWSGQVELDALMLLEIDAGGAADFDGSNEWFAGLKEEEVKAFFALTEKYWRDRFVLSVGGMPCSFEIGLPDPVLLQKDVAGSPEEGLLINLTMSGVYPDAGGTVEVTWKDTEGPYLVVGFRMEGGPEGTNMIPVEDGGTVPLAKRNAPAGEAKGAKGVTETEPPSLWLWIKYGFVHILPRGLDHILFVLGLFLLVPQWKPLLMQSAAFTVAHSITLGMVVMGYFRVPPEVVEPMIALSIAYVAVENLFVKELKPWRVGLVFGLGLLHGMGFAGVMQDLKVPAGQIVRPLLGFNVGVELGQVAVLALAFAGTFWCFRKEAWWARVRMVCSLLIAITGLYWTVERIVG